MHLCSTGNTTPILHYHFPYCCATVCPGQHKGLNKGLEKGREGKGRYFLLLISDAFLCSITARLKIGQICDFIPALLWVRLSRFMCNWTECFHLQMTQKQSTEMPVLPFYPTVGNACFVLTCWRTFCFMSSTTKSL